MDEIDTEKEKNLELEKIFAALSAPLPEDAVQHMDGTEAHKGYDADGYKCQFCINRFNEVLRAQWGYTWKELQQKSGTWGQQKNPYYDITVEVKIWVLNKENTRPGVGGNKAGSHNDALSGAITNGFKRAARFWGVGRQAYEGLLGTGQTDRKKNKNKNKNNSATPLPQGQGWNAPVLTPAPAKKEISLLDQYRGTINKLQLSKGTIQEYRKYLKEFYVADEAGKLSEDQIKDQLEVLAHILAKYENKIFIEKALRELNNNPKDPNYIRPIKKEICRIMETIYGNNQTEIIKQISTMTTKGITDLDKMNPSELREVLNISNILLVEFKEQKAKDK